MTPELRGPGIPEPVQDPTDYADTVSYLRDFAEGLEVEPWKAATEAAVKLREAIALLQTLTETEDE